MTMQNNIDIVRRDFGRNMHQSKLQTFAGKVDNQRPVGVPIAIAAHDRQRRTNRFQIEGDRRLANITEMPNLIRACRHVENCAGQFVVCISENKDFHRRLGAESSTTKSQEPSRLSSSNVQTRPARFEDSGLEFPWSLGFGISNFGRIVCFTHIGNS